MFISAFDLDHTLLSVNASFLFGKYLFREKHLSTVRMGFLFLCYAGHIVRLFNIERLHQLNFDALFKGRERRWFQACVDRFLDEQLDGFLYQPLLNALHTAQKSGHHTAILSSSPDFLVESIAQRLGVNLTAATNYCTDGEGRFSFLGPIMHGENKAKTLNALAARLKVPQQNIYAYSDSALDLPFLHVAGHPVAVRPDRKLRKISETLGWRILL